MYKITTAGRLNIDGEIFEGGEVVGTIESDVDLGNLVSGIKFGKLAISREDEIAKLESIAVPASKVTRDPDLDDPNDPDALNAADAAAEAEAAKAEAAKAAVDKAAKTESHNPDESLAGLDKRIQRELAKQASQFPGGVATRDSLKAFHEAEGDFADLDGIGPKAAKMIVDWLE